MRVLSPGGTASWLRSQLAHRRVNLVVRCAGYVLVFGGFLLALEGSLMAGLSLVLLGWLVTRTARATLNARRLTSLLDGLTVRDALEVDPPGVAPSLVLETLLQEDSRQTAGSGVYPVRQDEQVLGVFDVLDADRVPRAAWATTHLAQVMRPIDELDAVPPDQPLLDTVARFERTRREAFAVVDPQAPGCLVGLVTRERVHGLMRSRAARAQRASGQAGR